MISAQLPDLLADRVRVLLENFRLEVEHEESDAEDRTGRRAPTVIAGLIPARQERNEDIYPFVSFVPFGGEEVSEDEATADVTMFVGVHKRSTTGYKEAILLHSAVLSHFRRDPVVDSRAILNFPVQWELVPEVYPFWLVSSTLNFTVPASRYNTEST